MGRLIYTVSVLSPVCSWKMTGKDEIAKSNCMISIESQEKVNYWRKKFDIREEKHNLMLRKNKEWDLTEEQFELLGQMITDIMIQK